jgi:hypothetical protein
MVEQWSSKSKMWVRSLLPASDYLFNLYAYFFIYLYMSVFFLTLTTVGKYIGAGLATIGVVGAALALEFYFQVFYYL